MVLAAGLGLRMRPLTRLRAKPALPVMNRPLIHWTLELLARHGVREVMVNLHHLPRSVQRVVEGGPRLGLRVRYSHERRILGTGGGPRKVRAFFGDEPFLLVNGDVLFDFDLGRLLERHVRARAVATLGLLPNPDPRRYSPLVRRPDGLLASIAGRPRPRRGRRWMFTGVQVLEPRLLERLPAGASDTVAHLYVPLIAEGERVLGVPLRGRWYDFGSPPLYLASQLELLRSGFAGARRGRLVHDRARVHRSARVAASVVGASCVVGEGARVERSVLWDGARVGPGCVLREAIVTGGARLPEGLRAEGAIVLKGKGGRVEMAPMVEGRK